VIRIAWVNSTWSLVCDKIQLRSDKVVVHTVTTAGPTPGRAPQRGRQTFKIYPSGDDSRSKLCHRRTGAGTRRNGGNICRRPMGGHTCTKCVRRRRPRTHLYQVCPPGRWFWPKNGRTHLYQVCPPVVLGPKADTPVSSVSAQSPRHRSGTVARNQPPVSCGDSTR